MLRLTRTQRVLVLTAFTLTVVLVVVAPLAVLLLAGFAASWTTVVPTSWTTAHIQAALQGDSLASLSVSLQTALVASLIAVTIGVWAALAARGLPPIARATVGTILHLPSAVPSVVVGLGALVTFSGPPLMLGGNATIVIVAQTTLVLSFAYSSVSSAATRLDPRLTHAAASLGSTSTRIITRIELPLLLPAIGASLGLALAMAMGELGATIMVYPPSWRTLPITIFTASDRGDLFNAAACTLVLVAVTVTVLAIVAKLTSIKTTRRARRFARTNDPNPPAPTLHVPLHTVR